MNNIKKIYKQYYKNNILFELIINVYLLHCNFRNIFQLQLNETPDEKLIFNIKNILNLTNFNYIENERNDQKRYIFIIYNQKTFDIDTLDKTYGKKYAKQLGLFYKCASNNIKTISHNHRITITIINHNNNKCEIYAQLCRLKSINNNIKFYLNFSNNIKLLLHTLDKRLLVQLNIELL